MCARWIAKIMKPWIICLCVFPFCLEFIHVRNTRHTLQKYSLIILAKHENQWKFSECTKSVFTLSSPSLFTTVIPNSACNAGSDWLTIDLRPKRSMRWTCSAGQYLYANEQDNTRPIHCATSMNEARMNIHKQNGNANVIGWRIYNIDDQYNTAR